MRDEEIWLEFQNAFLDSVITVIFFGAKLLVEHTYQQALFLATFDHDWQS